MNTEFPFNGTLFRFNIFNNISTSKHKSIILLFYIIDTMIEIFFRVCAYVPMN